MCDFPTMTNHCCHSLWAKITTRLGNRAAVKANVDKFCTLYLKAIIL